MSEKAPQLAEKQRVLPPGAARLKFIPNPLRHAFARAYNAVWIPGERDQPLRLYFPTFHFLFE